MKLPKRFSRFFTTTAFSLLLAFMVSVLPLGGQDRYEDVFQRRLDRADATDGKARADEHSFRLHRSLIRVLCQQVNAVAEQACGGGGELFRRIAVALRGSEERISRMVPCISFLTSPGVPTARSFPGA